jgi:hypothetical protein
MPSECGERIIGDLPTLAVGMAPAAVCQDGLFFLRRIGRTCSKTALDRE